MALGFLALPGAQLSPEPTRQYDPKGGSDGIRSIHPRLGKAERN
jgi:hypothetical protein